MSIRRSRSRVLSCGMQSRALVLLLSYHHHDDISHQVHLRKPALVSLRLHALCRTQGNPVANGPIFNRVVVMTNSRNKLLSKCGSVATDDVDLHGTTSKLFEILSSWGLLHVGVCWGTKMEQESHCVRKRGERSGRLWRDKREGKLHQHQRGLGLPTTSSTLFFSLSFYPSSLSLHRNSRKCAYPIHLAQNTRHTPLPIRYLCQHGVSMTRLSTALSENSSRPLDNGRPSGKLTFVRRTQSF